MEPVARISLLLGTMSFAMALLWPVYGQESSIDWEQEYGIEEIAEADIADFELEETAEPTLPDWIGGFVKAQHWEYRHRKEHPLNPEEQLLELKKHENTALLSIKLDPKLSDSWRLISYDQFRYQSTDLATESRHYSQELYLQWMNDSQSAVVNGGKVLLEWGPSYQWNPVQLLLPNHDRQIGSIYEDEGLRMLFAELSANSITGTFVLAELDDRYSEEEKRFQTALKLAVNLEAWELASYRHQATNQGDSIGVSFSGLVTDALELHGEWSSSSEKKRDIPRQLSEGIQTPQFYIPGRFGYEADKSGSPFREYLLGVQYTFLVDMNVIFEMFHTDHGYDEKEWDTIRNGMDEAHSDKAWSKKEYPFATDQGNPYAGFLKNTMKEIKKQKLRQNYLFLRYTSGDFMENWAMEQILIFNADDSSQMHRFTLEHNWQDELETTLSMTLFEGGNDTEFGLNPYRYNVSLSISYNL